MSKSQGGLVVISDGKEIHDSHPTGRSEYLLCSVCELKFSKWETCAANWFYNWEPTEEASCAEGIAYKDIQYLKFRLYCLSIFWRMSESNLDYFERVSLTAADRETIRQALLSDDTLDFQFPVCFTRLEKPDGELFPISMQPYTTGEGQGRCVHLITNGFVHDFWVSDQLDNLPLRMCALRPEGTLVVPIFPYLNFPPVREQIARANKPG